MSSFVWIKLKILLTFLQIIDGIILLYLNLNVTNVQTEKLWKYINNEENKLSKNCLDSKFFINRIIESLFLTLLLITIYNNKCKQKFT